MGACGAVCARPPQSDAPRAGTRAPVAPGGQAGPFGSPRHGPVPGGPCARRFGVRWCSQGANGGPKGSEPIFCIFYRPIGPAVLVLGFLSTLVVDLDW